MPSGQVIEIIEKAFSNWNEHGAEQNDLNATTTK